MERGGSAPLHPPVVLGPHLWRRIWAGFSLPGRSRDKEQWGGAQAASQHDGQSELSIHPATE